MSTILVLSRKATTQEGGACGGGGGGGGGCGGDVVADSRTHSEMCTQIVDMVVGHTGCGL